MWSSCKQDKSNFLLTRSYNHPRVAGIERKEKCEDPKYQSQPKNSFIYEESADTENITPVNTYYPPATVCYVDPSGGAQTIKNTIILTSIPFAFRLLSWVWCVRLWHCQRMEGKEGSIWSCTRWRGIWGLVPVQLCGASVNVQGLWSYSPTSKRQCVSISSIIWQEEEQFTRFYLSRYNII